MQGKLSLADAPCLDLPWDLPPPPQAPPAVEGPELPRPLLSGQNTRHPAQQPVLTSSSPFVQNCVAIADFGEVNLALEALPLDLPPPPQRPPTLWKRSEPSAAPRPCIQEDLQRHQPTASVWQGQANAHEQDWEQKAKDFFNASVMSYEKPEFRVSESGPAKLAWGGGTECLANASPLSCHTSVEQEVESKIFGEWQLQAREALINETLDDLTFVQESYAAAERDLEWRKATSMSKRLQVETRQAELAVYQKRVQTQEKDVVADEELVRCREAQLDSDAQHLRRCENALKAEAKRVKQRRDDLDNSEPMLQRKEEELLRMQEELSKLEKEVSEAEQEIQHRSADIAAAEAQLRRRRAELSSRHAEVAGDRRALNSREAELLHRSSSAPTEQLAPSPSASVAAPALMPEASHVQGPPAPAPQAPPPVPAQPHPHAVHLPPTPQAPVMLTPPAPAPAMPVDPVQQNLALQLQQTQQMLQMQQMQQLQSFMKAGFGGPAGPQDSGRDKEREKLQALEDSVMERLESLEKHEAALSAVMAAAAQAAKETQEATAAIVSQSTEAAKESAAAIMAKSSEVVRSAVQDMTEALAIREQEALQAMSVKLAIARQKPRQQLVPPSTEDGASPKLAGPPAVSVACNTDTVDLPAASCSLSSEHEVAREPPHPPQQHSEVNNQTGLVHRLQDQQNQNDWDGLSSFKSTPELQHQPVRDFGKICHTVQGRNQTTWIRPVGARRAALCEGHGIEDARALASAAALLRGEQPQLAGEDGGELWCGESDATPEDGPQKESGYAEGPEGSMFLDEQISRSSVVQRSVAEVANDISESEPPSPSVPVCVVSPGIAWEISLNDWPRTPSQRPEQSSADLGRRRMQKAQEAARRQVEEPARAKRPISKASARETPMRPKD